MSVPRPKRPLTLPSGEIVLADDPESIRYDDDEIAALTRGLDRSADTELVDLTDLSPAARAKLTRRARARGKSVADVVTEIVERHA